MRASPSKSKNPEPKHSEGVLMDLKLDEGLKALIESGKHKGFLTYSQVNEYLPDDAVNPEKLDQLLMLLEEQGIDLIDEAVIDDRESKGGKDRAAEPGDDIETELRELDLTIIEEEGDGRRIDDPVR